MNKLPWFKHQHDSHQHPMLRGLIREHGHVAHTIYWTLCELVHWKGRGNHLRISISDFAHAACTHPITVRKVLDSLAKTPKATSGMTSGMTSEVTPKLRWRSVGTEMEVEFFKFREKQENMRFKPVPNPFESRSNSGREEEREIEREEETSLPSAPKARREPVDPSEPPCSIQFNAFWSAYPRKTGKLKAWQIWRRLKLDKRVAEVVAAVRVQARSQQWIKMGGQYVPHPSTWLNQGRWMDEESSSVQEAVDEGRARTQDWLKRTGALR